MATDILGKLLKMLRELHMRIAAKRTRTGASRARHSVVRGRAISESFRKLKRGEITLRTFLDEKIDHALAPLATLLHESDVLFIRSVVVDKLDTDPVLSTLVARIASAVAESRR
jgi:hypothetical protein